MQGWISIHRKIMQNPLWLETRKFSKAEAWIDMLLHANHKRTKVLLGAHSYELGPGQFITSQVKLADKWEWDRETVKKFLDYLSKEKSIDYETSNRNTIITISNWNTYQKTDSNIPATEPASTPQQNQQQISTDNNDKNVNNEKINTYAEQVRLVFEHFCTTLNKKIQLSPERGGIIEQRLKEGRTVEEMKEAINNFSKDTWENRHQYCDLVYAIGTGNKVNNLDKWLNSKESKPKLLELG